MTESMDRAVAYWRGRSVDDHLLYRPYGTDSGPGNCRGNHVRRASDSAVATTVTAGQVSDIPVQPHCSTICPRRNGCLATALRRRLVQGCLQAKGIQPCIPGRRSRLEPIKYDKRRYRRRSRIEIMFGRLKDWRRVATRYDRCPTVFLSAIALAATVIFWL